MKRRAFIAGTIAAFTALSLNIKAAPRRIKEYIIGSDRRLNVSSRADARTYYISRNEEKVDE